MNKATLAVRHNAEQMASLCRNYGTSRHGLCPKGAFVCPFMWQTENGSWTTDTACRDVDASDWEAVLEPFDEPLDE